MIKSISIIYPVFNEEKRLSKTFLDISKFEKLNKFLKKEYIKHFPAIGTATLSGVIVEADVENGLAKNVENFIYGGDLKNSL